MCSIDAPWGAEYHIQMFNEDGISIERALQFLIGDGDETAALDLEELINEFEEQVTRKPLPHGLTGRIPFEVVELIVDTMSQGCLATCALVCRAWYHAISRVIYRDIEVSSRTSLESLVDFIRRDPRALGRLQQASSLRIIESDRIQPHNSTPTHVVPLVLGRALPNVGTLIFLSSIHPQMHASFFATLSVFRGVTTLELLRFKLRCFSELRQSICAFPGLRALKLADGLMDARASTSSHDAAGPRLHAPTKIRLNQLVLGWDLTPSFVFLLVRWLVESSACVNLTHLAIWRWPLNIAPQTEELLISIGEALLVLHEFDTTSDGLFRFINVPYCIRIDDTVYSGSWIVPTRVWRKYPLDTPLGQCTGGASASVVA